MENPETIQQLYRRFLNHDGSPEELHRLFGYFETTDEQKLRTLIREELSNDNLSFKADPARVPMLMLVQQQVNHQIDLNDRPINHFKLIYRIIAPVAAVLVLLGIYLFAGRNETVGQQTVSAAYGKMIQVTLPDQSKVWLNAGSTLIYPDKFTGSDRIVELKNGEAYFDVKHNAKLPFKIHTKGTEVVVLGTSFEISAFDEAQEAHVSVSIGKVSVKSGNKYSPILLLPGERANINQKTSKINKTRIALSDVAAWREQRLVFDDQPLGEVIHSLERKFNVRIQVSRAQLLSEKVSLRFENQPLENILTALSFAKHFNYKIIDDRLIQIN